MKKCLLLSLFSLFLLAFAPSKSLAQAGASCANPFVLATLPFNQTGMTTCGFGDDFSSLDACGSSYMGGDDFVFTYTSAGNESVTITLTNTGTWVGVFVMDGCPSTATTNCINPSAGGGACTGGGTNNTQIGGNPFGTWDLVNPGTYYFVVSTWPAPQCTPFDISITSGALSGGGAGNGCYAVSQNIAYNPDPYNIGTIVSFPDDEFSNVLPIGFDFCFMGTIYNQFVISSNGYITFETACAGGYSTWVTSAIPAVTPDEIRSSILGPWQDIDPSVGGNLRYTTLGTAPNRRLVVNYQNIPMFSGSCNSQLFTGQITIYETSNVIENYIQNKTVCATWNSGNAVQGLMDASGTVAVAVPGRNNTQWTTTNNGTRFTPTCSPCLIILNAAYREFTGTATENGNLIQWETLFEEDMAEFVLERSQDGVVFEPIRHIGSEGNADNGSNYQVTDTRPYLPVTYYRMQEVSVNGEVNYSEVITVKMHEDLSPIQNLYVDASTDELVISLDLIVSSPNLSFHLIDAMGRQLVHKDASLQAGQYELRFDLSDVSEGYYILEIQDGKAYKAVQRFIKH